MKSSQRVLRWAVLLLLAALPGMPILASVIVPNYAYARAHHTDSHHNEAWARDHFATAERMREALNGRPEADRARRDYQRVLNAYRNVYFGAPDLDQGRSQCGGSGRDPGRDGAALRRRQDSA